MFDILMVRMQLSEDLGKFKKEHNITILQPEHWRKLISARLGRSSEYNLSDRFVRQVMDAIHQESIRHQVRVMNNSSEKSE